MMMWGDWNDDKSTLIDTWKFYNKYADTFPLTAMTPFPGTDYYKEVEKKGIIADKDFSNFTMVNVVMPTKHLGYEEAKKVYTRGLARYFIHWRVLREALFSKNPFLRYQQRTYIKLAENGSRKIICHLKTIWLPGKHKETFQHCIFVKILILSFFRVLFANFFIFRDLHIGCQSQPVEVIIRG